MLEQIHQMNIKKQQRQQQENTRLLTMITQLSQTQVTPPTQNISQEDGRPSP